MTCFNHLQEFIAALEAAGEVLRVHQEVSPILEISKLTDRESKRPNGGKALIFEKVSGSRFPVATNLFGSPRRICMALGVTDLDELGNRIRKYTDFHPPKTFRDALNMIPMAVDVSRFFPRKYRGKTAPCQEVVLTGDQIDLTRLPVLQCWPGDAGRFITLPLVFTRSLESGKRNMGMYRMQIYDRRTTGMHWHIHKDGSHFFNEYRKAGKRMPVAVAIGADPATVYAATAPMPRGIDEIMLAGFIRKKPVTMVKCQTVDLEVPAESEFVLEGYVDPDELRREGPFGDHTGYYSLADDYPVFHVTAITHRKHPVYHATLVGPPPMEDCYLAKATERLFLPMLQTVFPEIQDYWFPWEGVFHNIVVVALDKEYPGHAQKIISGLWGQGQMSFCKVIAVVDRSVNPADIDQLAELIVSRLDIQTDITRTTGILDALDHSSPYPGFGWKMGIDLTERQPPEPPRQAISQDAPCPSRSQLLDWITQHIPQARDCRRLLANLSGKVKIRNRLLAISIEKPDTISGAQLSDHILSLDPLHMFNIIILFDVSVDLSNRSLILWKLFNNVDPGRDIVYHGNRVAINACAKSPVDGHYRQWPDDLRF